MALSHLAISIGDSAGIGPEVLARFLLAGSSDISFDLTVFAPPELLEVVFHEMTPTLGIDGGYVTGSAIECRVIGEGGGTWTPGSPSALSARIAWESLDAAIDAVRSGRLHALVTLPIHKANMRGIGFPFDGHTDYLAARTGTTRAVMCYDSPGMVVALATTHIGLRQIFDILTPGHIEFTSRTLAQYLQRKGISNPRLAIAGLNPHAGSGDRFGDEEQRVVEPAVHQLRIAGFDVSGPIAPDTVFLRARRGEFDAVVSLYHDQGSIAIKTLDFDNTVNVTLGLPIIRTSVDHGTAFDLAGKGRASFRNLEAATILASILSSHSR